MSDIDTPESNPKDRLIGLHELFAVFGVGLVAVGLWQIYEPLMFLWVGVAVLYGVRLTLPVRRIPNEDA